MLIARMTARSLRCLVFSGALALADGAGHLHGVAAPAGLIPVKVLYGRYLSSAPLAIAQAEGYFRDQGLDVELVHLTGNSEATPARPRPDARC